MSNPAQLPRLLRFGQFELDLRTAELYKEGKRIKLQEQPCQVLALLIERPGDLVSREELRKKLWPNDTFVDFNHGVNIAINKLRDALGDSAEKPRFIETLPRRGYRFVAPVEAPKTPRDGEPPAQAASSPAGRVGSGSITARRALFSEIRTDLQRLKRDTESHQSAAMLGAAPVARNKRVLWITGALTVTVAAVLVGYFFYRPAKLTEKDTIVLADFDNKTGDPVFDGTLRQGLSVQLEQSPFLSIISDQRIRQTLQMMGQKSDVKLTPQIAREVCQRVGSRAYLTGSIANLGSQYVIGLSAVNCQTGDALVTEQVTADSKEHVLKALDEAAAKLRRKVGESLPSIQRLDTPLEQATTPSLEALKAYSLGIRKSYEGDPAAAIAFFKRAIELDPNFALAYMGLGVGYWNLGDSGLARENLLKAYELRERVGSEREKLVISALYTHFEGNLDKAIQAYGLWAQTYPRQASPLQNLGAIYGFVGQNERKLAEDLEAIGLSPDRGTLYGNLMQDYIRLNNFNEAKATYERALAAKIESYTLHTRRYQLAFLENDAGEMERQLAWSAGKPGIEDILLSFQYKTEAYFGHMEKARVLLRRTVDSAQRNDEKGSAAEYEVEEAGNEADYGNFERAQQGISAALSLAPSRDVQAGAAIVLARTGDSVRAGKMADQLAKQFPQHTLINRVTVPTVRAAIEVSGNHPSKAIEVLQAVSPYELGYQDSLYSAYLRGLAYLLLHKGNEAATEFQRVLEHRGIVWNASYGALARLGLGRAYALQGDTPKAKAAYQDFLALWKDADPNIPILKQAKAEYEKLE